MSELCIYEVVRCRQSGGVVCFTFGRRLAARVREGEGGGEVGRGGGGGGGGVTSRAETHIPPPRRYCLKSRQSQPALLRRNQLLQFADARSIPTHPIARLGQKH